MAGLISGSVAPGFEGVFDAFSSCLLERGETGASFAAFVDGRLVVDLWGGDGVERDSLVHVYSCTKPLAAFCVLVLVDRGLLGWTPRRLGVARVRRAGKDGVTVRQLLSHQAGLAALRSPQPAEVLFDWDRLCALLAAEAPWWEPGTGARRARAVLRPPVRRARPPGRRPLAGDILARGGRRPLAARRPHRTRRGRAFSDDRPRRRDRPRRGRPLPAGGLEPTGRPRPRGRQQRRLARSGDPGDQRPRDRYRPRALLRRPLGGGELDGVRLVAEWTVAAMTAGELIARS